MKIICQALPAVALLAASAASAQQAKQPLPLKLEPAKTTPAITTADLMTRIYRFAGEWRGAPKP